MTILDINLAKREEMRTLPEGEYEMQIVQADVLDYETKAARIRLRLEPVGESGVFDIFHTLWLPNPDDTPKQENMKLHRIANFMKAIGLNPDVTQIDLDEWVGCKFYAIVRENTLEDGTVVNEVRKVVSSK